MRPVVIEEAFSRAHVDDARRDIAEPHIAVAFREAVARAATTPVASVTPALSADERTKRIRKRAAPNEATTARDDRIAPVERRARGATHAPHPAIDDAHREPSKHDDDREVELDAAMVEALVALLRRLAGRGLLDGGQVRSLVARLASLGAAHDRREAKAARVKGVQAS